MTESTTSINLTTIIKRGVAGKCPHCGQGRLFANGVKVNTTCNECGLLIEKNSGDSWGFLLFIDRAFLLVPLVLIFFGLPDSWSIRVPAMLLLIIPFVLTVKHRRGATLALDYYTRVKWGDPNDTLPKI